MTVILPSLLFLLPPICLSIEHEQIDVNLLTTMADPRYVYDARTNNGVTQKRTTTNKLPTNVNSHNGEKRVRRKEAMSDHKRYNRNHLPTGNEQSQTHLSVNHSMISFHRNFLSSTIRIIQDAFEKLVSKIYPVFGLNRPNYKLKLGSYQTHDLSMSPFQSAVYSILESLGTNMKVNRQNSLKLNSTKEVLSELKASGINFETSTRNIDITEEQNLSDVLLNSVSTSSLQIIKPIFDILINFVSYYLNLKSKDVRRFDVTENDIVSSLHSKANIGSVEKFNNQTEQRNVIAAKKALQLSANPMKKLLKLFGMIPDSSLHVRKIKDSWVFANQLLQLIRQSQLSKLKRMLVGQKMSRRDIYVIFKNIANVEYLNKVVIRQGYYNQLPNDEKVQSNSIVSNVFRFSDLITQKNVELMSILINLMIRAKVSDEDSDKHKDDPDGYVVYLNEGDLKKIQNSILTLSDVKHLITLVKNKSVQSD